MAKFEVYKDTKGEYRWRLKAGNGEVVADGNEGYASKQSCLNGIRVVKENAADAEVVELESK
ncbi:MAG TPA: HVO_2922 family protein [Armatimonadaceae bacterium]|nr:HVO_2922 family protein [Armatimonadaceae bacterium]